MKTKLYNRTKIFVLILILLLLATTGFSCKCVPKGVKEKMEPVRLTYWRVWEGSDAFSKLINDFRVMHPNMTITVRKLRLAEYEQALLEAWAEDRGPDIFAIPNTWLGKYQKFIKPMPDKMELSFEEIKGTIKKEKVYTIRDVPGWSLRELRDNFVDVVQQDVLIDGKIYGLPLALDTLVLYWNRDLLNNAGIAEPPADWTEFAQQVKKLTLVDKRDNIIQAGAALGTAQNVENAGDILSLLMLQNGTRMMEGGRASFNQASKDDPGYFPGEEALRFYTDFANPNKEVYTWDENQPSSLDAFIQGKAAFFFGYSYHLPLIKAQAPKLNFDIAQMPQIKGTLREVNYADYWVETVSKKTKYPDEAWGFLKFASEVKNVQSFLSQTGKPTAHRALITKQLEDFDLRTFAGQVLTAKSWYQGNNFPAVVEIFGEMIESVVAGTADIKQAITTAAQKVNQTL